MTAAPDQATQPTPKAFASRHAGRRTASPLWNVLDFERQGERRIARMNVKLPRIISDYINASNAHDVKSILSCFSDEAVVHDEGETLHGKKAIEGWIAKTIEKYKFQFKPLSLKENKADVVVTVEVSGTFDGSPATLDYHFTIENEKILSLTID